MNNLTRQEAIAVGSFPIVGVGASAGGLAAFAAFFSGMPVAKDPGMAFVLVQHLAPDHQSLLAELVQRSTRMPVHEVKDGMAVQVNCVYIIPPNRDMACLNATLHLLEPTAARGHRLPIDFLFRSLAQDQRERAIAIVLSGSGRDGTLGVRAIKEGGGMVMVQNRASAEFDAMPCSAQATGLVDYALPPAEMPAQLIAYTQHAFGKPPRQATGAVRPQGERAMKKIFILLRAQTRHDFSQYKPSTIDRRVERRMALHQVETLDNYVAYLQQTPGEVEALFRDLLIGVTQFFRDPDAFAVLQAQVVPKLLAGRRTGSALRVWIAGCSTGEEAYSIAILLHEQLAALQHKVKLQIFATDIDVRAIGVARAGVYPASIAQDITPERLARYFKPEADGSRYRVQKSIREMLVFSEQDVMLDPPFSRLDLISCRNLLIYLGVDLQRKLVALFHYALSPGGSLFLGSSETVGELVDLFTPLERKAKLYQRKEDSEGGERAALGRFLSQPQAIDVSLARFPGDLSGAPKLSPRELTEQALLQQVDKAAALVNAVGDVLYLHGRSGLYLEPAPGEAGICNLLQMARDGLRRALTTTLHRVASTRQQWSVAGLRVKTNGPPALVNLTICPVVRGLAGVLEPPLYLVILEQAQSLAMQPPELGGLPEAVTVSGGMPNASAQIAELHEELQARDEHLKAANEELETSNEELMSSNEEMQSVNEELQSSNEELETSKEELQSINEELSTVNTELQIKLADLSRANNDMNNLLAGTGIATLFLDHSLRVLRFTPTATALVNLIPSDLGRPVSHIVSNLVGYGGMVADAQAVLNTLIPKAVDVQTTSGATFTMRILPYRTLDNVVEGIVITFTEITEIVHTREALRKANEQLRQDALLRDAHGVAASEESSNRPVGKPIERTSS